MKDMMRREIVLSERMQMVADMISRGNVLADIGCDHGFVSIYLLEKGICPKVIAMDVNEGPLLRAKEHIDERGLTSYIDVRLSNGMEKLLLGEADSILIAGMGGRLVIKILTDSMEKAKQLKEIVLQPQSEIHLVRQFLRDCGFHILHEDMVKDNGKFYPAMRVVWREEKPRTWGKEPFSFVRTMTVGPGFAPGLPLPRGRGPRAVSPCEIHRRWGLAPRPESCCIVNAEGLTVKSRSRFSDDFHAFRHVRAGCGEKRREHRCRPGNQQA